MGHTIEDLEERIRNLEAASFALKQRADALHAKQLANVRAMRFWLPVAALMGSTATAIYFLSQ